jgi:hypothetical protein
MNDEIDLIPLPPPPPEDAESFIIKRLLSENFSQPHLLTDIDLSQLINSGPVSPPGPPIRNSDGEEILPVPDSRPLAIPNVDFAYNKDYQIIYMIPKHTPETVASGVSYMYLPPVMMS